MAHFLGWNQKTPKKSKNQKNIFLYFRKWSLALSKKVFLYLESFFFYILGNEIFLHFRKQKSEKTSYIPESKKFLIFREMGKISCTLGLLLILFAERKLYKHKREITFSSLPAAAFACRSRFKFRLYEQFLIFLLSWLVLKSI